MDDETSAPNIASSARIIGPNDTDIHLDVVTSVHRSRAVRSPATLVCAESRREELTIVAVISEVEPFQGAGILGQWEDKHVAKTDARLDAALGLEGLIVTLGELTIAALWKLRRFDTIVDSAGVMTATLWFDERVARPTSTGATKITVEA